MYACKVGAAREMTQDGGTGLLEAAARLEAVVRELRAEGTMRRFEDEALPGLVALLDAPNQRFRFFVGDLVLHQGGRAVPALTDGTRDARVNLRRSAVFLLGECARRRGAGEAVVRCLERALADEDAKVRRNAAIALGRVSTQSAAPLAEAIRPEALPWVRASMILALGAQGDPAGEAFLRELAPAHADEQDAVRKALDRLGERAEPLRLRETLEPQVLVELRTAPGLEDVLREEVAARGGEVMGEGRVRVVTADLAGLFGARSFEEMMLPIGEEVASELTEEVAARLLTRERLAEGIARLYGSPGREVGYRFEVRGRGVDHPRRRRLVRALVAQVASLGVGLRNSPSGYDVELRLEADGSGVRAALKLFDVDARFAYRTADLPASIAPHVAAGLVRLLPASRDAKVLDPFCGSGTLLIERARRGGARLLRGFDVSGRAVDVARANIAASGARNARADRSDVARLRLKEPFDELVSNLPFGIRSGRHEQNVTAYGALFERLPRLLRPGGRILLLSQEIDLTTRLFREHRGIRLVEVRRIETGGLLPGAFIGAYAGPEGGSKPLMNTDEYR